MNRGAPPTKEEAPRLESRGQKSNGFEQRISVPDDSCNIDRSQELIEHQGDVSVFRSFNGPRCHLAQCKAELVLRHGGALR